MTADDIRARGFVTLQIQDSRSFAIVGFMVLTVAEAEALIGAKRVRAGVPASEMLREAVNDAMYGKKEPAP